MNKKELELLLAEQNEQLKQAMALIAVLQKPSKVRKYWDWCKPYIIPFIIGVMVGVLITNHSPLTTNHSTIERQAAQGGAAVPLSERQSLAESLELAAGRLDRGDCRFTVDEYIRTAIAVQPTSGRWANTFNPIIASANSPDAMIYANNLRMIAKGLKR